jgi:hypothetical protein
LEACHPRGLRMEQGRNQEAPIARSDRWGTTWSLAAARHERWAAVVSRRLTAARRERWGTTVSKSLAAARR